MSKDLKMDFKIKYFKKINIYFEVSQNLLLSCVWVPLSVFLKTLPYLLGESLHANISKP